MINESEFLSFAAGVLGVPAASVSRETACGTLPAWDSVMHLRLVMEVGAAYGVDIPLDRIPFVTTLGRLYDEVKERA